MRKFVIVGTGGRGTYSFAEPIFEEFAGEIGLAGIYDRNPKRMQATCKLLGKEIPMFTSFAEMMETVKPDGVVVTSQDSTHAEYVVGALERGVNAYSEKPLCTTVEQVQAIRRAADASSATGYVTHNMRFGPDVEQMKRLIVDGAIGKVLSITFVETLDRFHGADYFRRWHRMMENSAGLLVHKSSHHFDAINWLADSRPQTVTGLGSLSFYGKNGTIRGERCSTCAHAKECFFYADVFKDERLRVMYKEPEDVDGYHRDGCVFDPRIDIYDTMSASIKYQNGIVASYSLIAYATYESMRIAVEGTEGRLELYHHYGTGWAVGHKEKAETGSIANDGEDERDMKHVYLYDPVSESRKDVTAPVVEGGHGGSDPKLRRYLFGSEPIDDPIGQRAPLEEGIQAVLVGLAVNASIKANGAPINVQAMAPR